MRSRHPIAVLFIVVLLTNGSASALTEDGGGDFTPDPGGGGATITVGITVGSEGSQGGGDPAGRPVLHYEAVPDSSDGIGIEHLCNASDGPADPADPPWGWWYTIIVTDASNTVIDSRRECVPITDPTDDDPPPPPIHDTPPTIGEIWRSAAVPAPTIGVDPQGEGVVGLDTYFWSSGPDQVTISATLDGYTVTGTARLVEYRFDPGDGPPLTSPTAGSHDSPALTHVYETKGLHRIAVSSVWTAEVTVTGPGLPGPVPTDIGTATITAARDYRVVEVRSVLLP